MLRVMRWSEGAGTATPQALGGRLRAARCSAVERSDPPDRASGAHDHDGVIVLLRSAITFETAEAEYSRVPGDICPARPARGTSLAPIPPGGHLPRRLAGPPGARPGVTGGSSGAGPVGTQEQDAEKHSFAQAVAAQEGPDATRRAVHGLYAVAPCERANGAAAATEAAGIDAGPF